MDPVRYRLTLAYDGTDFCGWQKQEPPDPDAVPGPHGDRPRTQLRTVQHVVEQAVREALREPSVQLVGASRTDSGVHAGGTFPDGTPGGQVAAFTTTPDPDAGVGWPRDRGTDALVRALNSRLPSDVLVLNAAEMSPGFNPIGDATSKAYSYRLEAGPTRPLWDRRYVYWTWHELDTAAMNRAAAHLVGEHDFAAFAQINHGRATTVREIFDCRVTESARTVAGSQQVRIDVSGSGFLYNMVRIIAGTLVEVGRGKLRADDVPGVIASGDRRRAGPTLAPEGLRLEWIRYG